MKLPSFKQKNSIKAMTARFAGQESKPPVVLVHGFGASAYHWRYVIPELAKNYSVYAIDLLGFGMSSKPSVVYNGYNIWSNQLTDFINEVCPLECI